MSPVLGIIASSSQQGRGGGPVGAYDALATINVPSGGATSIVFAGIPTGYQHLQLRGIAQDNRTTYNQSSFGFRINNVSTSSYSYHFLQASWSSGGTTVDSMGGGTQTQAFSVGSITSSVSANYFGAFVIDFLDYANTNKFKTIRGVSGLDAPPATGFRPIPRLGSGLFQSTSAITSITILSEFGTQFNQYSSFALYGVK
jgi:hypothetical protein